LSARKGASASGRTIQGEILDPKFFPLNGPRGTYSHFWISLALQSFKSTNPKICDAALEMGMGSPRVLGVQRKAPSSSSMSRLRQGLKEGIVEGGTTICPLGRRMGVPEMTMEEERPW
jgi:hypothetical protein